MMQLQLITHNVRAYGAIEVSTVTVCQSVNAIDIAENLTSRLPCRVTHYACKNLRHYSIPKHCRSGQVTQRRVSELMAYTVFAWDM